jgi:hypothetical protein
MTTDECNKFYKWEPGVASFTTIFAEAWVACRSELYSLWPRFLLSKIRQTPTRILVVRTYALWGKNKYILAVLLTGLTIECVVLFFAVTQFHPVPTRDPTDPTSRGACIAGGGPGGHDWSMVWISNLLIPFQTADISCAGTVSLQAYWVSPIVMDTLMLILTSIRVDKFLPNI